MCRCSLVRPRPGGGTGAPCLDEVATLAAETAHYFAAQDVQPEALAAVLTFEQAAAAGEATLQQIHSLARYLEQLRHQPAARRPPS